MNMRQIDTRGRIINGNTIISLHPFRISIAAIIISILCLTNPANELSSIQPSNSNKKWNIIQRPTRKYVGSFSFDLFGFEFDLFQSKRYKLFQSDSRLTNYVLFSLDKSDRDGVYIRMLHQKIRLCSYDFDDPFGEVCDWIADNMCHGMTLFHPKNRPFTAHRITAYIIITFMILSMCSSYGYIQPVASVYNLQHRPISILLSVIPTRFSLETFFYLNFYIYPYFVLLDKVISSPLLESDKYYYGYSIFLFFGIGSSVNLISSMLSDRGFHGMHGVVAAALGYINRMSPSREIIKCLDFVSLTASEILFAYFIVCILDASFTSFGKLVGSSHGYYAKFILPWVLGGMAGSMLAEYHLKHFGGVWWF